MPNWCDNILILECNDAVQIQRAIKAYNENRLLSEFLPEPDYKTTPVFPTFPENTEDGEAAVDPSQAWWDWRIQNWGTKWDVGSAGEPVDDIQVDETGTKVQLEFQSAWSPPLKAMRAFEEAGFSVELFYCEYGYFCGEYTTEGGNKEYDITGTVDEVRVIIPDTLEELFGILDFCEK